MTDVYETKFGIFNHISGPQKDTRPLAAIAMHFCESPNGLRSVSDMINLYVARDVFKNTGVTLTEFLELPHEEFNSLLKALDAKLTREANIASDIDKIVNK